jgi:cytochrome P450
VAAAAGEDTAGAYGGGRLAFTRACVLEAVRLYSPGIIVRQVMTPTRAGAYTVRALPAPPAAGSADACAAAQVPAGHMLCLCPQWTQRDPALFEAPDAFRPARWLDGAGLERSKAFIAFGSGKYRRVCRVPTAGCSDGCAGVPGRAWRWRR